MVTGNRDNVIADIQLFQNCLMGKYEINLINQLLYITTEFYYSPLDQMQTLQIDWKHWKHVFRHCRESGLHEISLLNLESKRICVNTNLALTQHYYVTFTFSSHFTSHKKQLEHSLILRNICIYIRQWLSINHCSLFAVQNFSYYFF